MEQDLAYYCPSTKVCQISHYQLLPTLSSLCFASRSSLHWRGDKVLKLPEMCNTSQVSLPGFPPSMTSIHPSLSHTLTFVVSLECLSSIHKYPSGLVINKPSCISKGLVLFNKNLTKGLVLVIRTCVMQFAVHLRHYGSTLVFKKKRTQQLTSPSPLCCEIETLICPRNPFSTSKKRLQGKMLTWGL